MTCAESDRSRRAFAVQSLSGIATGTWYDSASHEHMRTCAHAHDWRAYTNGWSSPSSDASTYEAGQCEIRSLFGYDYLGWGTLADTTRDDPPATSSGRRPAETSLGKMTLERNSNTTEYLTVARWRCVGMRTMCPSTYALSYVRYAVPERTAPNHHGKCCVEGTIQKRCNLIGDLDL